jgi:hypothetical protein
MHASQVWKHLITLRDDNISSTTVCVLVLYKLPSSGGIFLTFEAQDILLLLCLALPPIVTGFFCLRCHRPFLEGSATEEPRSRRADLGDEESIISPRGHPRIHTDTYHIANDGHSSNDANALRTILTDYVDADVKREDHKDVSEDVLVEISVRYNQPKYDLCPV